MDSQGVEHVLHCVAEGDDEGIPCSVFASPLASYVTGSVLVVDGGQNLAGSAAFGSAIEAMQQRA